MEAQLARGFCYLQVKPVYSDSAQKRIHSIKVMGVTQSEPSSPEPGCRVIRLELEIPDEQLAPLTVRAMPDDVRMKEDYEATIKNLGGKP